MHGPTRDRTRYHAARRRAGGSARRDREDNGIRAHRFTRSFVALAACLALGLGTAAESLEAGKPASVTVTAGKPTEYMFTISPKSVEHGAVLFTVVNKGRHAHGFSIDGKSTKLIKPHASTTLTVVFKRPGRYVYQCLITTAPPDFGPGYNDVPSQCGGGVLTVK
jgi:uncharacterized cupredoxin-like copper-binding protein